MYVYKVHTNVQFCGTLLFLAAAAAMRLEKPDCTSSESELLSAAACGGDGDGRGGCIDKK